MGRKAATFAKSNMRKLIRECNSLLNYKYLYLKELQDDIACIDIVIDNIKYAELIVGKVGSVIKIGSTVLKCSVMRYNELINFIVLILIPYCLSNKPLELEILASGYNRGSSCKKVMNKYGQTTLMYSNTIVNAVKAGLVSLTNAQLYRGIKIVANNDTMKDSNLFLDFVDNTWN